MIKNRDDLVYYIKEDKKRNCGELSKLKYLCLTFLPNDGFMAYKYLKNLRYLEYSINVLDRNKVKNKLVYI